MQTTTSCTNAVFAVTVLFLSAVTIVTAGSPDTVADKTGDEANRAEDNGPADTVDGAEEDTSMCKLQSQSFLCQTDI